MKLNSKQRKILKLIFRDPISSNIKWKDVESLFKSLGAEILEAEGCRVTFKLKGSTAVYHRPHPHKEIDKGMVNSIRKFLQKAGEENNVLQEIQRHIQL